MLLQYGDWLGWVQLEYKQCASGIKSLMCEPASFLPNNRVFHDFPHRPMLRADQRAFVLGQAVSNTSRYKEDEMAA